MLLYANPPYTDSYFHIPKRQHKLQKALLK